MNLVSKKSEAFGELFLVRLPNNLPTCRIFLRKKC